MVSDFTWNKFVSNVQQWSTERGIYEHSTATAQLLKAFSEAGELADAVIKNDIDALKDAIGDVAVCLINYSYLAGVFMYEPFAEERTVKVTSDMQKDDVIILIRSMSNQYVHLAIDDLLCLADDFELDFLECCEHAWNEIKDRKGRMVEGGAFVKD